LETFSNKYLNNFDILQKAIVGFEFEFYSNKPFYKLLEKFNRELSPISVTGKRVYHSNFTPDAKKWKIEPDLSLGNDGIELISGPMHYVDARIYLIKVLNMLQGADFKTSDKCSIHINISFDAAVSPRIIDNLNRLKLILNMDEEYIYKYFPVRRNNYYAKSIKNIIPFKQYDFANSSIDLLKSSMELPDTKYFGVNFLNDVDGRVEVRYIGGANYQFKTSEISSLMDYFISLMWNCIVPDLDDDDVDLLKDYLNKNINRFKKFNRLDNFISEFPGITLQVDKNADLIILRTYYEQFYDNLYEIITNIYNLDNCIINYDTLTQKLEIVDANFKVIFDIRNLIIIDSFVDSGSFSNCTFINCDIKNSHITNCKIVSSDVNNCKVTGCNIDMMSVLYECYLYNSHLDGQMKSGVFRSGTLGDNAEIDKNVKIISGVENYFSSNEEESEPESKDKLNQKSNVKNKWMSGYNNQNNVKF
jgi:hypothetical protein